MRQRQTAADAVWLDVDLRTVEEHLALDEALLEQAHEGTIATTVVRTWMAGEPTVIVGSSSRLEDEVDAEACRRAGARILRRTSGGLAVVIGPGCLMWSVVQPHPAGPPPIERLHARMLDPLAGGLSTLVDAPGGVTRRGSSDLVVERDGTPRKVSGNALRVRQRGTLYHGTLLDAFDLGLVTRLLRHPPREPDYRAGRSHAEFVANLGVGAPALVNAIRTAFAATGRLSTWPEERVARLVAERYARAEWTARR